MKAIIKVEKLGKKYRIGTSAPRYGTLRDSVSHTLSAPFRRLRRSGNGGPNEDTIWALKDVSFEVNPGEVVGIIGRNGAGKSTLLKILSRITEPTEGGVDLNGRVGSLLEVGTGFHPELTGRENIYLNGAILGMHRNEIVRKFDEIVSFAEIERFVDTPVKHYSSGMYVRLAFAVAAHLDPEILVIDEVLAVGDAKFQKKCIAKVGDTVKQGKTILIVSHQMSLIESTCSRALVLQKGRVVFDGTTSGAITHYVRDLTGSTSPGNFRTLTRSGNGEILLNSFWLEDDSGTVIASASSGKDLVVAFGYEKTCLRDRSINFGFSIHTVTGQPLSILYSEYQGVSFKAIGPRGVIRCRIPRLPLSAGDYYVQVRILADGMEADWPKEAIGKISVESGDFYGHGRPFHGGIGPLLITGDWNLQADA